MVSLKKSDEVYAKMWESEKKGEDYKRRDDRDLESLCKMDLKESLRIQLDEYEMLLSMFSNPGEFAVDYSVIADINDYLNEKISVLPPELDYTICLTVDEYKLELYVNLPLQYPQVKANVYVKSDSLNRYQQNSLNENLRNFLSKFDEGEIIVCSTVSWLQEQASEYFNNDSEQTKNKEEKKDDNRYLYHRVWIYSHHIYNKFKRKEILEMAHKYSLTGFCLPGKPGIICIEGPATDCEEYWREIKQMSWKKISCKHIEKLNTEPTTNFKRKFLDFKEIYFDKVNSKSQNQHMDFGDFYNFLLEHECEYMFKELFGVDGN